MKNIFQTAMLTGIGSSSFDLSHDLKTSFKMGQLVPTCLMEVLPGDNWRIRIENFLRFTALVSPVMHRIGVKTEYYFVPNRLVWPEWPDWATGESVVAPPTITGQAALGASSLGTYLGLPLNMAAGLTANAMPFAMYNLIYDEYYRDQNIQAKTFVELVSGANSVYDAISLAGVKHRSWEHDYLTSNLPFAQKGTEVLIPLTTEDPKVDLVSGSTNIAQIRRADTQALQGGTLSGTSGSPLGDMQAGVNAQLDPNDTLEVKMNVVASTIETLRRAFSLRKFLERDALGGTRYIENIFAQFGIRSSDKRLNRPEYIGGANQRMVISEVLSTAETLDTGSDTIPIGELAGHGISVGSGNTFSYRAEEHGYIMGILSVIPRSSYMNGLDRHWSRKTREDYYWPPFANLGEQAVLNQEVTAEHATPEGTFGYIPRYAEYKHHNSNVSGDMLDQLKFWHLGRDLSATAALNNDFIKCDPSTRIFAVAGGHHIQAHVNIGCKVIRKMPKHFNPM